MTVTRESYLQVDDGAGASHRVALHDGLTIGRSATTDLQLDSPAVSRHHATLTRDTAGRWCVRDHDSHNGTYVNGQRTTHAPLEPGDCIQIDTYTLTLEDESPTANHGSSPTVAAAATRPGPAPAADDAAGVSLLREVEPPRVSTAHLALLSAFGSELINTESDDQRRDALCRLMVGDDFHASAAVVVRLPTAGASKPELTDHTLLCPVQQPPGQPEASPYFSRTLLSVVRDTGEPTMASNVRRAGAGGAAPALELSLAAERKPMAAIACPVAMDRAADAMAVLYVALPPTHATGEWLALVALAVKQYQQAELAWTGRRQGAALAAIERELEQARRLQLRLVPRRQAVPGLETAIAFEPCRWVGGDYADIVPLPDGRTLLAVADVCGKGMQAALTTTSVHAMVHAAVRAGATLPQLMQNLNSHLIETLPDGSFVTMAALIVDPATGELAYINAGHPPTFVVSPTGNLRQLDAGLNLPLGLVPDELAVSCDRIEPGHWLAVYSDGLSELSDGAGQMLGIDGLGERLRHIFAAAESRSAAAVADDVMAYVHQVEAGRMAGDDYTLLLARRR
ncbi:MAG: SpoIIE family protein phosphatase [Phycisphaeraceae bacterium]